VLANGIEIAKFKFEETSVRACIVPWELIREQAFLTITFEMPDAARPFDFVENQDDRQLGVALRSLTFAADQFDGARTSITVANLRSL
jgi:hypothetical protein